MSAVEKQAPPTAAFVFLAPLTNEPPALAGSGARQRGAHEWTRTINEQKEQNFMKILFASDIHGSAYYCRRLLDIYKETKASRMVILGDILYHGPRNDLPKEYAPKEVIAMLNPLKDQIYAVRGNCDTEVDQMVLQFPILADYALLVLDGKTFYATHGHVFNQDHLPPMQDGDILVHGHTHLLKAEKVETECGTITVLNPGSVSIPKGGNPNTYAILEDGVFTIYSLDGEVVKELKL